MKKILLIVAMAMVLACGVGVKGADATPYVWTPSDGDINLTSMGFDFGGGYIALVDDSVDVTTGTGFNFLTVLDAGNPSGSVIFSTSGASHLATLGTGNPPVPATPLSQIDLGASYAYQLAFFNGTSWEEVNVVTDIGGAFYTITFGDVTGSVLQGDGSPTVPIPAAAWLLCSGLFGLIGIRRRMNREKK
ncbi:MAG: VPLPA-CTERM sorting domain-containing protein [Pseudomonadota bacterium]|nr:VPLPA-CTERM sorting domain-containing protein [Pseudomonadota bacterium]